MSAHHVVILGAGAAGTAAARALADHPDITTTIVGTTGEAPYSRMLIKGVAHGMTPPEFVRLAMPQANFSADTVESVDTGARHLRLATLHAQGHQVTLIARSELPGVASFGRSVAERMAAEHRSRVSTFFGRTIRAIHSETDATVITLDDTTEVEADLILLALGTTPFAPEPWHSGVNVDERLRAYGHDGVYAAGGVAVHHDDHLGTWRIDHWDDAVAQGTHAARMLLHTLARSEDPGPYLPRSAYMAMIYGQVIAGAGYTGAPSTRIDATDEAISLHEKNSTVVGVSGIDAIGAIYQWGQRLHEVPV